MSGEIKEKIQVLEQRHRFMTDTWEKRKVLYEQNLDTQVFILLTWCNTTSMYRA